MGHHRLQGIGGPWETTNQPNKKTPRSQHQQKEDPSHQAVTCLSRLNTTENDSKCGRRGMLVTRSGPKLTAGLERPCHRRGRARDRNCTAAGATVAGWQGARTCSACDSCVPEVKTSSVRRRSSPNGARSRERPPFGSPRPLPRSPSPRRPCSAETEKRESRALGCHAPRGGDVSPGDAGLGPRFRGACTLRPRPTRPGSPLPSLPSLPTPAGPRGPGGAAQQGRESSPRFRLKRRSIRGLRARRKLGVGAGSGGAGSGGAGIIRRCSPLQLTFQRGAPSPTPPLQFGARLPAQPPAGPLLPCPRAPVPASRRRVPFLVLAGGGLSRHELLHLEPAREPPVLLASDPNPQRQKWASAPPARVTPPPHRRSPRTAQSSAPTCLRASS